ncbi:MAG: amidohydrolase family protein [Acidobacteriia bacterium]|nr:amidohydrolase family protein [Terriglobia bacterium]
MMEWSRRSVLKAVPGLALDAAGMARSENQQPVRWSAGTELPKTKVSARATDCHFHIYDARFPADAKAVLHPPDATVADYRLLQKRLGTTRCVIIQPSTYGLDNRLLLEALGQFGAAAARGIAVVHPEIQDAELKRMHAAGVRGIRFNLVQAGATTLEMVDPLSKRVASLGWHIQVHASADQIEAAKDVWNRASCLVVFDHLGHLPEPQGIRHPAFRVICALLQKGRAWLKLSGFYMDTQVGPPSYADSVEVARAYVKEAPERLVWGSDWPHPTVAENDKKPNDAILLDLLAVCVPETATRNRILVDNAAKLYGF